MDEKEFKTINDLLSPEGIRILNNEAGRMLAEEIKRSGRIEFLLDSWDEIEND